MQRERIGGWVLFAMVCTGAAAPAAELAALSSPGLAGIRMAGFEIVRDTTIQIEAVGREEDEDDRLLGPDGDDNSFSFSFGSGSGNDLSAYAWIIDAGSREPVWEMEVRDTEPGEMGDLVELTESMELPAGRYEVYLTSNHASLKLATEGARSPPSVRRRIAELEEELEHVKITITANIGARQVSKFEPDGVRENAVIAITGVGDGELNREAFSLDRELRVQLYGLMEYPGGSEGPSDFGWIVDLETGARVWDMSDRHGRRAGGGQKNRMLDRDIKLGPGEYMLVYRSNDSHSAAGFNVAPPDDPMAWGVQLIVKDPADRSAFRELAVPSRGEPLIDFSRAGDDEFFDQAFRLTRGGKVHIHALGEGVDDGWTWVDYGWIIDAKSGETVWAMDDRNTFYAGGADKNRVFDGAVSLPAGDYIVFYSTDDSHSSEDFRSAAPFEPDAWGLQLFTDGDIQLLDMDEIMQVGGVLVSITRVRDHDRVRERFSLDRETEVEIYALGEGGRREMHDYGWIRDLDRRRVVWEMDYRDTHHAGGARKNREVRARITLPAGEYEVVYETDDSHSFGDWNDRQPDNPLMWGITLYIVD